MEEDIISGERLLTRPVMLEILDILEQKDCIYDGVLVVDYDRLSRGGSKDFGTIIEVFQYADKYIITPDRIYDSNDQNDLTMLGIQGVFAHNELRKIVGRFIDGKKDGAMLGKWTNGKPPYPYEYVKKIELNEKGKEIIIGHIIINDEKLQVYNRIKDLYINKKVGTEEISFILNRESIPSPGGKMWSSTAVQRLLLHEFHLGKVIYGKNEWKKNRENKSKVTRKRDESEWSIGEGTHIPVKTQEEHDSIIEIMSRNQKIPRRSRQGVFLTSGILYCKKCNHRMRYSVEPIEKKTGKQYSATKCYHRTYTGEKCPQVGIKMDEDFYNILFNAIVTQYKDEEYMNKLENNSSDKDAINKAIVLKNKQLQKNLNALEKIQEAFEEGEYDLQTYSNRKQKREKEIDILQLEISDLETQLNSESKLDKKDLNDRIDKFQEVYCQIDFSQELDNISKIKELNSILKTIVKKIYYNRIEKEATFEVEYL